MARTINSKIEDLQNSLDSLSVDEADLAAIRITMQNTTTALQTAELESAKKSWDQRLTSIDQEVYTVDEELRTIQSELASASAQNESRAKVDVLKSDLNRKCQSRQVLISYNAQQFKSLVGTDLTDTTQDSQINTLLRRKADDLEEAERMFEGAQKEVTQYEAKLATIKEQLKEKQKERNRAHSKVMAVCDSSIDDFPAIAKEKEEDVVRLKLLRLCLSCLRQAN